MNSILSVATDAELDNYTIHTDNLSLEDSYDTVPVVAIQPLYPQLNEEDLYTSFEEAISDRLMMVRERLSRISTQQLQHDTEPLGSTWYSQGELLYAEHAQLPQICSDVPWGYRADAGQCATRSLLGNGRQRMLIFACLALICMLSGFDLMGLLVLHMR